MMSVTLIEASLTENALPFADSEQKLQLINVNCCKDFSQQTLNKHANIETKTKMELRKMF